MRRLVTFVVLFILFPAASRAAFEPKDVCAKTSTGKLEVDRKRLVGQLLEKKIGVTPIDLDTTGADVPYGRKAEALTNTKFCETSACAKDTAEKLQEARVLLTGFFFASTGSDHLNGYRLVGPPSLHDFLQGPEGAVRIECYPKLEEVAAVKAK